VIRDALRRAISTTSLRAVARDVGMTAPGLQSFIDGGQPRAATARKLIEWYVRDAALKNELSEDSIGAALHLLTAALPVVRGNSVRESILATLREAFTETGCNLPSWLATPHNPAAK
jgi:hypothetical protein